jgi:hypothetical protein
MKDRSENREALLWLKGLAGQAARNRRAAGLEETPQIRDVLAIEVGAAASEVNVAAWIRWACAAVIVAAVVVVGGGGFAAYTYFHFLRQEHASFAAQLKEERQEYLRVRQDLLRDVEPAVYANRIRGGIERLGGRPQDRDRAIWDYLLRVLQESQSKEDYFDVVAQFRNVLPHLQLAVDSKTYRDSYRGELWIAVYLLESPVSGVAADTRRRVPPIKALRALYESVGPELRDDQRADLAKSIGRLEVALKSNRY